MTGFVVALLLIAAAVIALVGLVHWLANREPSRELPPLIIPLNTGGWQVQRTPTHVRQPAAPQSYAPQAVAVQTAVTLTPETLTPETVTAEMVTQQALTPETVTAEMVTPETVTPEMVTPETVTAEMVTPVRVVKRSGVGRGHGAVALVDVADQTLVVGD